MSIFFCLFAFLLFQQIHGNLIEDFQELIECSKVTIEDICPNSNVTFWLYTSDYQEYQLKENDFNSIQKAPFKADVPIVILIHGWTGSKEYSPNSQVRPEYLRKGYNVISVDYGPVAPNPCYREAVKNSPFVSKCVAEMIKLLIVSDNQNRKISIADLHVIGFSLGGQIAGRAGTLLKDDGLTLPRITGLDVAGPLFYGFSSYISKDTADFVDIIHTNAGELGKLLPVGHVDFYVNNIFLQNGCNSWFDLSCHHSRAPELYAESIESKFCGTNIHGEVEFMGYPISSSASGIYHVSTNGEPPYHKECTHAEL